MHSCLDALTAIYCHNRQETGIMTIRCATNEKIRMLDVFDVIVKDKSRLPPACSTDQHASMKFIDDFNDADCKVPTSFTSACSGRENCTIHLQRIRLSSEQNRCQNEWVDYTIASYECIAGRRMPRLDVRHFVNEIFRSIHSWCLLTASDHFRVGYTPDTEFS